MNLNNKNALFLKVGLSETTVPGFLLHRTKEEKQVILKRCNEEGKEENLNAICSRCELDNRKVEKKDAANPHYGCVKKCCPMLHYWNMCSYCIQDVHLSVVQTTEKRHAEVVKFQRVFSRLPEDIQLCISEYVPQVFAFIRSLNRVISYNLFGTIERQLNLPKSQWIKVQYELQNRHTVSGLSSRSSRKQICEKTKDLYKRMYNKQFKQIGEPDFWTHRPHAGIFHNNILVDVLEKIQTIIPN
jgi:hypothetical protein